MVQFILPVGIDRSRPIGSIYGIFFRLDQGFCPPQDVLHRNRCVSRTRWGWYMLNGSSKMCWVRPQEYLLSGCSRWDYPHIVWPKLWGRTRTYMWSLHYSADETPKSLYARVRRAEAHEVREISPTSWKYFRIVFFGTTNSLFVFWILLMCIGGGDGARGALCVAWKLSRRKNKSIFCYCCSFLFEYNF